MLNVKVLDTPYTFTFDIHHFSFNVKNSNPAGWLLPPDSTLLSILQSAVLRGATEVAGLKTGVPDRGEAGQHEPEKDGRDTPSRLFRWPTLRFVAVIPPVFRPVPGTEVRLRPPV